MMERGYMLDCDRYDESTDTLHFKRYCGIGSNMTILMDVLIRLKLKNICPKKIVSNLTNYKGYDMFKEDLYIDKNYLLTWKNLSVDRVKKFYDKVKPTIFGYGNNKNELDLELLLIIFNTYFNLTKKVHLETNFLKQKYNIINKNFDFIFFRKTDKKDEVNFVSGDYPELSDTLNLTKNKNVLLQTDDLDILKECNELDRLKILKELPIATNVRVGVHDICKELSNNEYKEKYGHEYKDHGCKLLAIMKIASESNILVGYPGNLTFHTCLMRKSFDNVFFFKNKNTFY